MQADKEKQFGRAERRGGGSSSPAELGAPSEAGLGVPGDRGAVRAEGGRRPFGC